MEVPQILRSRVAPFAIVYGILLGASNNWSDAFPQLRRVTDVLLLGAFTVAPAFFGYMVVREAREPSILYGVFAPVYVVVLAVIAAMFTMTGDAADSGAVLILLLGMPLPALLAIVGGMYGGVRGRTRLEEPDPPPAVRPPPEG